ncbi:MAG: flagellar basal body-associated FliL family protein, partial [Nitrospinae bacterium]|nr:flagellar basal body-associated FliL family protein [Nitrospinota bacterium]
MAAKEDKEIEKAEEPKEEKKSSSLVKVIIIILVMLILLLALAVGGFIAWTKYIAPAIGMAPHGAAPTAKEKGAVTETTLGPMLPLEPFIVNLAEAGGKRFIKVTMEIELSSKELEIEVKGRLPQFKDHIITVLS